TQRLVDGAPGRAGQPGQEEVRLRRRDVEVERPQRGGQARAFGRIGRAGALDVARVVEGRAGRGLPGGVDVEGKPYALEGLDRLRGRHRVADAQSGQAVDLREGAHRHQPFAPAEAADRIRITAGQRVLEIGR